MMVFEGIWMFFCEVFVLMFSISLARYQGSDQSDMSQLRDDHEINQRMIKQSDMTSSDDSEIYIPEVFEIEDFENGFHRAIELMTPVELMEWDHSRRIVSELDGSRSEHDGSRTIEDKRVPARYMNRCGEMEIDPVKAICCNGLIYLKNSVTGGSIEGTTGRDIAQCCGHIAYDSRYFICCQGRSVVRRTSVLPVCCVDSQVGKASSTAMCNTGYEQDKTGLGSTCCRTSSSSWKCCLKTESCCRGSASSSSSIIDVPGFRPVCCLHITSGVSASSLDQAAQCCARIFEHMNLLPECCDTDRLRPVCCRRPSDGQIKCCSASVGYCCGHAHLSPPLPTAVVPLMELPRPHPTEHHSLIYSTRQPYYPDTRLFTTVNYQTKMSTLCCHVTPSHDQSRDMRCCCCTVYMQPCCRSASYQKRCCRNARDNSNVCCQPGSMRSIVQDNPVRTSDNQARIRAGNYPAITSGSDKVADNSTSAQQLQHDDIYMYSVMLEDEARANLSHHATNKVLQNKNKAEFERSCCISDIDMEACCEEGRKRNQQPSCCNKAYTTQTMGQSSRKKKKVPTATLR